MKQRKFNIWVGTILLLAMLATCYAAINVLYSTAEPFGLQSESLSPSPPAE